MNIEALRQLALEAGTEIFNAPSEGAVEQLHQVVFPEPVPGASKTATLTICRVALACAAVAAALAIPARDYWAFLKSSTLNRLIDPHLSTAADRAAWNALESKLLSAAFGPEEEVEHA
jgi:hypothetical protein